MIVHWHRRDLRGTDNRGLARAAARSDGPVVPLFVLDPTVLEYASPIRVACLLEALAELRAWYRDRGSDLLVVRGEASEAVPRVAAEYDAETVVRNGDYSGLARHRRPAVLPGVQSDETGPRVRSRRRLHPRAVPELADATADEIHGWHDLEPDERERIAPDYPAPIVDHAERRERAIAAFERARGEGEESE